MKSKFRSIFPPSIIGITWFLGGKEFLTFSEPVALILIGVVLIGFGNMGKKRFRKKS